MRRECATREPGGCLEHVDMHKESGSGNHGISLERKGRGRQKSSGQKKRAAGHRRNLRTQETWQDTH